MSDEEIEDHITQNLDYIISSSIRYVHFLEICDAVKADPILTSAMEYSVSAIWPYLAEMRQEYFGGVPKMLQAELKAQRNVAKQGNIYVDLLISDRQHEYLVRYASIFTKGLKPLLGKLSKSMESYTLRNLDNEELWYYDEHVRGLLQKYLPEDDYHIIAPTVFDNTDLLRSNTIAAVQAAILGERVAVMPINLHLNHWVGAVISLKDRVLQVIFNNPFGDAIALEPNAVAFEQTIRATIRDIYPDITIDIVDLQLPQQRNNYDCGPFTVDNLIRLASLARGGVLVGLSREEILEIAGLQQTVDGCATEMRKEHYLIFEELTLPVPGSGNNHQLRQQRASCADDGKDDDKKDEEDDVGDGNDGVRDSRNRMGSSKPVTNTVSQGTVSSSSSSGQSSGGGNTKQAVSATWKTPIVDEKVVNQLRWFLERWTVFDSLGQAMHNNKIRILSVPLNQPDDEGKVVDDDGKNNDVVSGVVSPLSYNSSSSSLADSRMQALVDRIKKGKEEREARLAELEKEKESAKADVYDNQEVYIDNDVGVLPEDAIGFEDEGDGDKDEIDWDQYRCDVQDEGSTPTASPTPAPTVISTSTLTHNITSQVHYETLEFGDALSFELDAALLLRDLLDSTVIS